MPSDSSLSLPSVLRLAGFRRFSQHSLASILAIRCGRSWFSWVGLFACLRRQPNALQFLPAQRRASSSSRSFIKRRGSTQFAAPLWATSSLAQRFRGWISRRMPLVSSLERVSMCQFLAFMLSLPVSANPLMQPDALRAPGTSDVKPHQHRQTNTKRGSSPPTTPPHILERIKKREYPGFFHAAGAASRLAPHPVPKPRMPRKDAILGTSSAEIKNKPH